MNKEPDSLTLTMEFYREDSNWVAHCKELDIVYCEEGKELHDVMLAIGSLCSAQIQYAKDHNNWEHLLKRDTITSLKKGENTMDNEERINREEMRQRDRIHKKSPHCCPYGHKFGEFLDETDNCEDCEIHEDCANALDLATTTILQEGTVDDELTKRGETMKEVVKLAIREFFEEYRIILGDKQEPSTHTHGIAHIEKYLLVRVEKIKK